MPKKNRLSGSEIRSLRSTRRSHGALFSLIYSPGPGGGAKFSCVISKKVAVKAVDRNLIKRRCRDIVKKEAPSVPPGSYLLYAKKDAATATYRAMSEDITMLIRALRGK